MKIAVPGSKLRITFIYILYIYILCLYYYIKDTLISVLIILCAFKSRVPTSTDNFVRPSAVFRPLRKLVFGHLSPLRALVIPF